jgi:hypothetical protein
MACIVNRSGDVIADGTPEAMEEIMVKAQKKNARMKAGNPDRYARSVVRAAIRRSGRTDAGQYLNLTDAERTAWERRNPLED